MIEQYYQIGRGVLSQLPLSHDQLKQGLHTQLSKLSIAELDILVKPLLKPLKLPEAKFLQDQWQVRWIFSPTTFRMDIVPWTEPLEGMWFGSVDSTDLQWRLSTPLPANLVKAPYTLLPMLLTRGQWAEAGFQFNTPATLHQIATELAKAPVVPVSLASPIPDPAKPTPKALKQVEAKRQDRAQCLQQLKVTPLMHILSIILTRGYQWNEATQSWHMDLARVVPSTQFPDSVGQGTSTDADSVGQDTTTDADADSVEATTDSKKAITLEDRLQTIRENGQKAHPSKAERDNYQNLTVIEPLIPYLNELASSTTSGVWPTTLLEPKPSISNFIFSMYWEGDDGVLTNLSKDPEYLQEIIESLVESTEDLQDGDCTICGDRSDIALPGAKMAYKIYSADAVHASPYLDVNRAVDQFGQCRACFTATVLGAKLVENYWTIPVRGTRLQLIPTWSDQQWTPHRLNTIFPLNQPALRADQSDLPTSGPLSWVKGLLITQAALENTTRPALMQATTGVDGVSLTFNGIFVTKQQAKISIIRRMDGFQPHWIQDLWMKHHPVFRWWQHTMQSLGWSSESSIDQWGGLRLDQWMVSIKEAVIPFKEELRVAVPAWMRALQQQTTEADLQDLIHRANLQLSRAITLKDHPITPTIRQVWYQYALYLHLQGGLTMDTSNSLEAALTNHPADPGEADPTFPDDVRLQQFVETFTHAFTGSATDLVEAKGMLALGYITARIGLKQWGKLQKSPIYRSVTRIGTGIPETLQGIKLLNRYVTIYDIRSHRDIVRAMSLAGELAEILNPQHRPTAVTIDYWQFLYYTGVALGLPTKPQKKKSAETSASPTDPSESSDR